MPTVLTRDQIKEADDRAIEFVKVPEWAPKDLSEEERSDFGIYVQGLSGEERDDFELAMLVQKKDKRGRTISTDTNFSNLRAKLIARTAVDSDDPNKAKKLFAVNDVHWLGKKNGEALQRVYQVAQRLSGLSPEDVDELTQQLGEAESDSSGTDSLPTSGTEVFALQDGTSAPESSANGSQSTESTPSEAAV